MSKISIPPAEHFRRHIIFVLLYLVTAGLLAQKQPLPSLGIETIITTEKSDIYYNLIAGADPHQPISVTGDDMLCIYACYHCTIKLMLSRYDEMIFNSMLENIHDHKSWGNFSVIRKNVVYINTYLMHGTEQKFSENKELQTRKKKLQSFSIG